VARDPILYDAPNTKTHRVQQWVRVSLMPMPPLNRRLFRRRRRQLRSMMLGIWLIGLLVSVVVLGWG
jgi:hypothetical protein